MRVVANPGALDLGALEECLLQRYVTDPLLINVRAGLLNMNCCNWRARQLCLLGEGLACIASSLRMHEHGVCARKLYPLTPSPTGLQV